MRPALALTGPAARALEPLARTLAAYGGGVLLLITAVTMANVAGFALNALARPLGGTVPGLSGYEEIVALLVGGAALAFLPWCQLQRGHVAVDLFTRHLPAGATGGIDRTAHALTAAVALFLGLQMAAGLLNARADGIVTGVRDWPVWPFQVPGVLALLVWSACAALLALDPEAARHVRRERHDDG